MPSRLTWYVPAIATAALVWSASTLAVETTASAMPPAPNCESEEYRQFDFWIGTWAVTEGGQPAGRNTIEPDLNRCALFESWSSVDGSRGRSINFYDRERRRWHQTWIDDRGKPLELYGGLASGSMVLEGERPDADTGDSVRHRITWTPDRDGSIRQHWQVMKSRQSTWETVFNGLYKRTQ